MGGLFGSWPELQITCREIWENNRHLATNEPRAYVGSVIRSAWRPESRSAALGRPVAPDRPVLRLFLDERDRRSIGIDASPGSLAWHFLELSNEARAPQESGWRELGADVDEKVWNGFSALTFSVAFWAESVRRLDVATFYVMSQLSQVDDGGASALSLALDSPVVHVERLRRILARMVRTTGGGVVARDPVSAADGRAHEDSY
jgi:hypothetical protein